MPGRIGADGVYRSNLVSAAIAQALKRIGYDYLIEKPPVALDEPYEIAWCLSYCDTTKHVGTVYKASGFELYRANAELKQTWRRRLGHLMTHQDKAVRHASLVDRRANEFRAAKFQLAMAV